MSGLDFLLHLPGAITAFEFNERGEIRGYLCSAEIQFPIAIIEMISHLCVANTAIATMQARGWEQLTGAQGFYPVEGISVIGLEWSVVSRGHFGVILDNRSANYEMAFSALGNAR
ncbi:DUF2173 family protein [Gammaproteobacteria bacterium]